MSQTIDYRAEAASNAADMVENFLDEVLEQLIDRGQASDDFLNDYQGGDCYHHENHVDRNYSLLEAATLLDELNDFEETDCGLWEGQSPREAISTQAAFTYGSAVYSMAREIINSINQDTAICHIVEEELAYLDSEVADVAELFPDDPTLTVTEARKRLESQLRQRVQNIINESY